MFSVCCSRPPLQGKQICFPGHIPRPLPVPHLNRVEVGGRLKKVHKINYHPNEEIFSLEDTHLVNGK